MEIYPSNGLAIIDGQAQDVTPAAPPAPGVTSPGPTPGPNAKRRYSAAPVEAVPAGGNYDETFYIRSTFTFADIAQMELERRRLGISPDADDATTNVGILLWLGGRMMERWTLENTPCTPAEFEKLPYEMTQPVYEAVQRFLVKKSTAQS